MIDRDISTHEASGLLHSVPRPDRLELDRRRFLQLVGLGVGAGLLGGPGSSLLERAFGGHDPSAWAAGPVGADEGILVALCCFGGNDGLNTVVPYGDGHYYDQHRGLAIGPSSVLPLNSDVGLNPALTTVKSMWDRGQVAVVDGIGYPSPDLSHFTSMAYWMSAQPSGIPTTGWIGRWLDERLAGGPDLYVGAEVGNTIPLIARGAARQATVVPPERPDFGASYAPEDQRLYQALRSLKTDDEGLWHAAISDSMSDFLDVASAVAPAFPAEMPTPAIVAKAETAARLINANLGFRVLTASWGDFDSHAGQPDMHPIRMRELDAAIARFFELLDPVWASRVTVMTYSEFGRTSWSNAGNGTDHGTAAPHLVIGANVKGGLYGQRPSLAGLGTWDRMQHHVDFRSYFGSVIDGWLGGGSSSVLGGSFEDLNLFRRGPGVEPDGRVSPGPAVVSSASSFHPVDPVRLVDTRDGTGGLAMRPIAGGSSVRVQVAGIGPVPPNGVTAVVANVTAVEATSPNFFTVYPGSTIRPGTSNLNAGPGAPIPNLVVMGVGPDGAIEVFNSNGTAHCLVDLFGYFSEGAGDLFTSVTPSRLFDTRTGTGVRPGKIHTGEPIDVQVTGQNGVPESAVTAVVVNLTVTESDSPGWMRLGPTGRATNTSNINFGAGDTVPNLVICKVGDLGRVTVDGLTSGAHVLGDVFGYFGSGGSKLRTLPPRRLLDTREGNGAPVGPVGAASIRLPVGGRAQVPVHATAVALNITAANVTGPSFVTVWPDGEQQPTTSNLNVRAGQTVANMVICRLGAGGALRLASPVSSCDLIADVLGYFIG